MSREITKELTKSMWKDPQELEKRVAELEEQVRILNKWREDCEKAEQWRRK